MTARGEARCGRPLTLSAVLLKDYRGAIFGVAAAAGAVTVGSHVGRI